MIENRCKYCNKSSGRFIVCKKCLNDTNFRHNDEVCWRRIGPAPCFEPAIGTVFVNDNPGFKEAISLCPIHLREFRTSAFLESRKAKDIPEDYFPEIAEDNDFGQEESSGPLLVAQTPPKGAESNQIASKQRGDTGRDNAPVNLSSPTCD